MGKVFEIDCDTCPLTSDSDSDSTPVEDVEEAEEGCLTWALTGLSVSDNQTENQEESIAGMPRTSIEDTEMVDAEGPPTALVVYRPANQSDNGLTDIHRPPTNQSTNQDATGLTTVYGPSTSLVVYRSGYQEGTQPPDPIPRINFDFFSDVLAFSSSSIFQQDSKGWRTIFSSEDVLEACRQFAPRSHCQVVHRRGKSGPGSSLSTTSRPGGVVKSSRRTLGLLSSPKSRTDHESRDSRAEAGEQPLVTVRKPLPILPWET